MVLLLRATELNLDNYSCNMIFAHPVEWTVLFLNSGFLCLAVIPKHKYAVNESAEVFKSRLMMIGILPLWVLFGVFPILGLVLCNVASPCRITYT